MKTSTALKTLGLVLATATVTAAVLNSGPPSAQAASSNTVFDNYAVTTATGGTTSSSTGTIVSLQTIPMSITTCTTAKGCSNVRPFCASSATTCYNKACNFVVDTTTGWNCECYLGQVEWCSTVEPLSVRTCVQLDDITAAWSECRDVADMMTR